MTTSRRGFLKVASVAGGALLLGFELGCSRMRDRLAMVDRAARDGDFVHDAWLRITAAGDVIFTLDRVEMGQGTMTSHAMLVAEELEVDPRSIRIELARADRRFDNPKLGLQVTGGSSSVYTSWDPLRRAAASAREMLRAAAAAGWRVPLGECQAEAGAIVHRPSGRRRGYGELASTAALMPIPDPELKPPAAWQIIGRPIGRLDAPAKVDGTAAFGIDVSLPGLLSAVVVRCPVPGGTLRALGDGAARAVPGVLGVFAISTGAAVVADTYWHARSAADRLECEWDEGPLASFDSEALRRTYQELAAHGAAKVVTRRGAAERALAAAPASRRLEARYEAPFLAHAPMEPMNATVRRSADRCEIWAPTQAPGLARELCAQATGLDHRDVVVHTTLVGGGFGRRLVQDYILEAVELAAKVPDRPVKVLWSREDDLAHDFYRPLTCHALVGAVDERGMPIAWRHRLVGPSLLAQSGPSWLQAILPTGVPRSAKGWLAGTAGGFLDHGLVTDPTSIEGAADLPYAIAHLLVDYVQHDGGVPLGAWRSVGHSYTAFVVEGFLDELAHLGGQDPLALRRVLLKAGSRERAVLELAAERAGWGQPLGPGRGRGLAQHGCFGSYAAQVAEVSVEGGEVRVHRVVAAIDCGQVCNPDLVRAQMESGVVFGLSAALKQQITFRRGRVEQSNFHDFPVLRMHEMPEVEVHIVKSTAPPTGVGEPGVPPVAPAVANAIFAASGIRLRRLPLEPELLAAARAGRLPT
jgi:CO/xanthine dehydrogenase Mo-binding subunit